LSTQLEASGLASNAALVQVHACPVDGGALGAQLLPGLSAAHAVSSEALHAVRATQEGVVPLVGW
jgi:hypothetical protein